MAKKWTGYAGRLKKTIGSKFEKKPTPPKAPTQPSKPLSQQNKSIMASKGTPSKQRDVNRIEKERTKEPKSSFGAPKQEQGAQTSQGSKEQDAFEKAGFDNTLSGELSQVKEIERDENQEGSDFLQNIRDIDIDELPKPHEVLAPMGKVKAAANVGRVGLETLLKVGTTEAATGTAQSAINTATLKSVNKILTSKFSKKALSWVGAWAGAVFLGKWGQAESPEPLSIIMTKTLIPDAIRTGDWSVVDEAVAARNEIMDLSWWEKAALWSPVSPFIGIPKKIEGAIKAAEIMDRAINTLKIQQETGQTDADMWTAINEEGEERAKRKVDYYNEQKLITDAQITENINASKAANNAEEKKILDATIKAWEEYKSRIIAAEKKDREESGAFWLEYQRVLQKIKESTSKSNLNFGLL